MTGCFSRYLVLLLCILTGNLSGVLAQDTLPEPILPNLLVLESLDQEPDLKGFLIEKPSANPAEKLLTLRLRNSLKDSATWILLPGNWEKVTMDLQRASGMQTFLTGHYLPASRKPPKEWISYPLCSSQRLGVANQIPVRLGPGETVTANLSLVRETDLPVNEVISLKPERRIDTQPVLARYLLQFFFLGMVCVLLIYHLAIFFLAWDLIYLHYALYMAFICLFTLDYSGILTEFMFPESPWIRPYFKIIADVGIILAYLLLMNSFIGAKENWPRMYKIIIGLLVFYSLLMMVELLVFVPMGKVLFALELTSGLSILVVIFVVGAARAIHKRGSRAARFFIWGSLFLALGHIINVICYSLGMEDVYEFGAFDRIQFFQLGTLIELVLFAMGIGARVAQNLLQKQQMEQVSKIKTEFFTNISHELRTPLSLILVPLESFIEKAKTATESIQFSPKKAIEFAEPIRDQANHLLSLITQLLDLSRIDAGKTNLQVSHVDLKHMLEVQVSNFRPIALQQKIRLEAEMPAEPVWVWLDKQSWIQVTNNLIGNALKFSPEGSNVVIALASDSRKASMSVKDNGPGIPADKLKYVFDRFFRVNEKAHRGTGIGLALTREIVSQHKGSIYVNSKEGKGSEFIVEIPLGKEHFMPEDFQAEELVAEDELHEVSSQGTDKATILVVDDHREIRKLIKDELSEEFEITEAADGQTAFDQAVDKSPELIISDIAMPGMDGFEFCRKLKQDQRTSHIPILMLTAKADPVHKEKGLSLGANDFLTKPFLPKELVVRSRNLIRERRKVREVIRSQLLGIAPNPIPLTVVEDQDFLNRLMDLLSERHKDSEFGVTQMAKELGLHRKNLHNKLKALTDQPPRDLLRNYRLERAAQLLKEGFGTVSEVAYATGFNHLSYFAKVFRQQYGVPPSQFPKP